MSRYDDIRYAQARAQAHGFDFQPGNRRHRETHDDTGTRGPTALEIALVRKLGGKVRLDPSDFDRIRDFTVHRTVDQATEDVILEVRDKNDARGALIEMVRCPDGSYAADPWHGDPYRGL